MYQAPLFICEAKETLFKIYIANVEIALETSPSVGCHMTHCAVPTKQPKLHAYQIQSCINNIQVTYSGALAHILTGKR